MSFLPDKALYNLPNIALVVFSTFLALVLLHFISKPFEESE